MEKEKVLIVDDEEEIREIILKYLIRDGIIGIPCDSGEKALAILENETISLVILDIMMEGMDGFETIKRIRQKKENLPVILLSARGEEYDKVLGLGLGADDYVTKPFSPGEFMARVKSQLRRQKSMDQKVDLLEYEGIRMNLTSYVVEVRGAVIELTGKEMLLLKLFMENPKRVFTKSQIYHQVWEDGFEDDNTVMVYISHLRDKIEKNPKEPVIINTIRGIGYRLG